MTASTTLFDQVGLAFDPGRAANTASAALFDRDGASPTPLWPALTTSRDSARQAERPRPSRAAYVSDRLFGTESDDRSGLKSANVPIKNRLEWPRPTSSAPAMQASAGTGLFAAAARTVSAPQWPRPSSSPSRAARPFLVPAQSVTERKIQRRPTGKSQSDSTATAKTELKWPSASSSKRATLTTSWPAALPADGRSRQVGSSATLFAAGLSGPVFEAQATLADRQTDLFDDDRSFRSAGQDLFLLGEADGKAGLVQGRTKGPSTLQSATRRSKTSIRGGTLFDGAAEPGASTAPRTSSASAKRIVLFRTRRARLVRKGRRILVPTRA
jgi:hypothetical protein